MIEVVNNHKYNNEVISVFVACSNEDYVTINWILRAQWISPQLPKILKPMSLKGEEINGIIFAENKEYSVRSDIHNYYSIESDVSLFVYHFKAYEIFKNVYQKIKYTYKNMPFDDFLQIARDYKDTIAKYYREVGDFGISKNKDFNDFLEYFTIISLQADNLKYYQLSEDRTLQNLKRNIDYDMQDIDIHIAKIEKGLPEWRKRLGVTDEDIEKINFVERKKPQYSFKQTIPVSKDAIDVYFNEVVDVLPDKRVKISGTTNLFDHASLMLTVYDKGKYDASCKTIVIDGKFEFEIFSKNGVGLNIGKYNAMITLSISSTQSKDFVKFAGVEYENLIGEYVKRDSIAPTAKYQFSFDVT